MAAAQSSLLEGLYSIPPSLGPADSLITPEEIYEGARLPDFLDPMAVTIRDLTQRMLAHVGSFTVDDVKGWLDRAAIARGRTYVQMYGSDPKHQYGIPTYGTPCTDFVSKDTRLRFFYGPIDRILIEEGKRISGTDGAIVVLSSVSDGDDQLDLSILQRLTSESKILFVVHPDDTTCRIMELGYKFFTNGMNEFRKNRERSALDNIAKGYWLLCHATPWVNGTPSILESFIIAFFNSLDLSIGIKTGEPFFRAMFAREYTWCTFIRDYQNPVDPLVFDGPSYIASLLEERKRVVRH